MLTYVKAILYLEALLSAHDITGLEFVRATDKLMDLYEIAWVEYAPFGAIPVWTKDFIYGLKDASMRKIGAWQVNGHLIPFHIMFPIGTLIRFLDMHLMSNAITALEYMRATDRLNDLHKEAFAEFNPIGAVPVWTKAFVYHLKDLPLRKPIKIGTTIYKD